jgi:hypothetical protein
MITDQTHRTLRAINAVLISELAQPDAVLLRLAYNLENAHLCCDTKLERELCGILELMTAYEGLELEKTLEQDHTIGEAVTQMVKR